MFSSTVLAVSACVIGLSTLAAGDAGTIITINNAKLTNNANDLFDAWSVDIGKGKKSSQLNIKMPVKQDLPDNVLFQFYLKMGDQDPIEQTSTLCEAMEDETIGKSFIEAGLPKDSFPKECPFVAGDWTISKWDPPSEAVPPGVPDGPISGFVMIYQEGKDPFVKIDFDGELSHEGMGR